MKNLPPSLRFLEANAWALEARVFEALADIVERHVAGIRLEGPELAAAIGRDPTADAPPKEPAMQIANGVAVIGMRGVVARYSDQVNDISQPTGRSAESILADLAKAQADHSVRQVVLRIDSPGGTVAGTAEIGDAVRALSAAGKPVFAFVDGKAHSAAYWIASQADQVVASSTTTEVGSIGVIGALVERAAARDVVKIHVVRSTPLKAPGAMGAAVSEEQLASVQRLFADLHDAFATAVAAGRGLTLEQQTAAATGEAFAATRALALGLIDSIEPWGAFLERVAAGVDLVVAQGDPVRIVATLSAAGMSPAATTAGASPASTPDTPAGTDTMRISAQVLLALIGAFGEHHALISTMATGDPAKGLQPATEDEIRAAISTADRKALTDKVAALEAGAATAIQAHTAAMAAKDLELAAMRQQLAKAGKVVDLAAGAAQDPGADRDGAAAPTDASLKAEWEAMPKAKRAGFFNDFDVYKSDRTAAKEA